MLDRVTNILVLFTVVAALSVLAISLHNAWDTTTSWEKEWVTKPGASPSHPAKKMLEAIRNATAARDYEAVRILENALKTDYRPSGRILVRFSSSEFSESAIAFFVALLFLIIPLSLNYVRHSKFRFWNRGD